MCRKSWPHFSAGRLARRCAACRTTALAARVIQPFVGDAIPFATLATLCRDAYAGFGHPPSCR